MSDDEFAVAGWLVVTLDQVLLPFSDGRTLHQGWSPKCLTTPTESVLEWGVLKTTAIQAGRFEPIHHKKLPASLVERPAIEVRAGDLVITCAGPRVRCGVSCLVRSTRDRLMLSGKMYRFRGDPRIIDAQFLELFLQSRRATDEIDRMKTGGSDSGLNLTHDRFLKLNVVVPPLRIQKAIVELVEEIFPELDAGISELQAAQKKLAQYRRSLLKAAVEGALTADWRATHPPQESGEALLVRALHERRARWEARQIQKFKAQGKTPPRNWKSKYPEPAPPDLSNLPELPGKWVWASLDQLAEIQGGIQKQPARAPVSNKYPFLRVANVARGYLMLEDVHEIELFDGELERVGLLENDVLIVEGNGSKSEIGRCAVWDGSIANTVHQNHLIRARPVVMRGRFLEAWINSHTGIKKLTDLAATTSGLYTLSVGKISRIPVPVAPIGEQEQVVQELSVRLGELARMSDAIGLSLKRAAAQRQNILRAAFTGQLVPQDPADEPASALLARIRAERATQTAGKKTTRVRMPRLVDKETP